MEDESPQGAEVTYLFSGMKLPLARSSGSQAHSRYTDGRSWHGSVTDLRAIRTISQASSVNDLCLLVYGNSLVLDTADVTSEKACASRRTSRETAPPPPATIPFSVLVMYFVAFLSHWTQTLTEFITWFVIEARSWTQPDDGSYYGLVYGIFLFGPVVMNPTVGWLSDHFAIKSVIIWVHLIAACGIAVMMMAPNQWWYALGAFMYASLAVRPLRTTYIAMATDPSIRTKAMAYLNLFTDCSKLVGVMTAKAWARAGPVPPAHWDFYGWPVDYLTLALFTAVTLLVINTCILSLLFTDETGRSAQTRLPTIPWTKSIKVEDPSGKIVAWNGDRYALLMTVYFCCIGFLHQVSFGLVSVSNLPVLSHVFNLGESAIANVKLCQDLIPCLGPILVAQLSRFISDRALFITGILLAFTGVAVFAAPLGSAMCYLQPLAGLVCMSVSQQFFYTADFSIFSKVLGPRASGVRMAAMASASALGATLGASIGGKVSEQLYGSWCFYILATPSVTALLLVLNPWFFHVIGPFSTLAKQIVAQWKIDEAAVAWDTLSSVSGSCAGSDTHDPT